MSCPECGRENEAHANICVPCMESMEDPATGVTAAETVTEETLSAEKKSKKKLWISLGAGVTALGALAAAFVVCVAAVIILLVSLNGPKAVAKDYMKSVITADSSIFIDIVHDDILYESFGSKQEQKEWVEDTDNDIEFLLNIFEEYYGAYEITYKIDHVEKITGLNFEVIDEFYSDYDLKVKKAKEVTFDVALSTDDDTFTSEITVCIVKIGTKWYLDISNSYTPLEALFSIFNSASK